jgi:N-methylhydantoinase A|tara:strand:- start:10497 stop:12593 length:2097 start_codon:yes stop_codon:yes gene_type:complete
LILKNQESKIRIGVDIGGTFTDVVLEKENELYSLKLLTQLEAPEIGVREGIRRVLEQASTRFEDVDLVIHGTTLATNAIIERKGARTAMITTEGFRDTIEMGTESRFDQYDIFLEKPRPLIPRRWRYTVAQRHDAQGREILPLDETSLLSILPKLREEKIESLAICLLHAFINPEHEKRILALIREEFLHMRISLSSEVSPEMREYERFSTTAANAYIQPVISAYLERLGNGLRDDGLNAPVLMMLSGGGLTTTETAVRFPIRLVESGPAGGAIFAADLAQKLKLGPVLSFDMGGTTAKICFIENGQPQAGRHFEVARVYRFKKGSGLPLRIPVIEMVEIGAGGGSLATVDELDRIQVGPESSGASPGPACYGQGGSQPAVTDADLLLGFLDENRFAGGRIKLDQQAAEQAVSESIATPLELSIPLAAVGISEMVDENMASAARVHSIESGKNLNDRTLIAFGGAAPVHASRVAQKLGIRKILIPSGAGVGSALGFLKAPAAYEIVQSLYQHLSELDTGRVEKMFSDMRQQAQTIIDACRPKYAVKEMRKAFMRYIGQGHEIEVELPDELKNEHDRGVLKQRFDKEYRLQYARIIPDMDIEILSWSLRLYAEPENKQDSLDLEIKSMKDPISPSDTRRAYHFEKNTFKSVPVFQRSEFEFGQTLEGPLLVQETDTSIVVPEGFSVSLVSGGHLMLEQK